MWNTNERTGKTDAVGRIQRESGDAIARVGAAMKETATAVTTAKIVLLVCLLSAGVACTQKAANATKDTVGAALDATKSGAEKTIDATKAAGDRTAEAAQKTADKTKDMAAATSDVVTDTWITGKLKTKFIDETLLKGTHITISTAKHVVTLSGVVASDAVKLRAGEVASGTEGVTAVVNQLVVR